MTVGSTTASFTRAVHTAKREIGIRRATGADPRSVFLDVFVDALTIGTTAAVLSMALAYLVVHALLAVGELRVFGLVLEPSLSPGIVLGALVCGVALSLVSATLAAAAVVRRDPATLLVDRHIPTPSGGDE
jgi:ABC-type antimicrobial peptide transport system permease subunit